ncbi:uncharacterized protein LOC117815811 isoform X1 [Xyrichtys novacula]|uniref:Uncharacterized protein LOC117815811 isoform X1 n=1 Tax=Xyrichtys novacula TaxID=13765 RepID=A0AAV1EXV7_XYRNO|nr:uncharacterized protein LOC117815811 isoform X1 [Xyrichtys novacula]
MSSAEAFFTAEPNNLLSGRREHSGSGDEAELHEPDSSGILPAAPVCASQNRWGIRGGEEARLFLDMQDKLLYVSDPAEGSIDQEIQSSVLEYWVCLDSQHNMADCPFTRTTSLPVTPVTHRPCAVQPVQGSVLYPMLSSPVDDTYSPITSMCSPTALAWDTLKSTSLSPGSSDQDPVRAAAHLHLLGESLSLIGQHLQETHKTVSIPGSFSLLLDSLLCALVPLISLTLQIPELRNCTQHTLASTLENINYLMPGL